jgi:hypothetical protein
MRGMDCEPHVDRTGSVDSLPCWSVRQLVNGKSACSIVYASFV